MKKIIINNLTKEIKGEKILDNVNIELESGKIYGFVGYNGSGKSMLFKAICGLIKPTEGYVKIEDMILGKDISFPRNIGVLIEEPGFIPSHTGFNNLKILADIQGKISDDQIKESLNIVGLDPNNKKLVKKYSLGMKQKLGIAQAIMENPEILILDEPMNALDLESVKKIRNLLLELKKKGKTILIASHNKEDIELLSDKIFMLDKGRVLSNTDLINKI